MITDEAFIKGVGLLKVNYNLIDYPKATIRAWFELLKDELSEREYGLCIRIIIKTVPNWYQAGDSLASRVLQALPQARQELRSDRAHLLALKEAKEAKQIGGISEAEAAHNVRKLSYLIELQKTLQREPRREGETAAKWFERKHSTVERKLIEFDDDFYGGKNGEKAGQVRQN